MSDCEEMLLGMKGWLRTVAYKYVTGRGGVERDDCVQEACLAILKSGVTEEKLAAKIAMRAMNRYRNLHGPIRVTSNGRKPINRVPAKNMQSVTVEPEPSMIFWENLKGALSEVEAGSLRSWVESGESADEIGRAAGTPGRTVRSQINQALKKVRDRWAIQR